MTVYMLSRVWYSDMEILGLFTTREAAKRRRWELIDKEYINPRELHISEMQVED